MSNIIIIGNGPAGISTALYITRAGIDTMIIGKDLITDGMEGARRLGAEIVSKNQKNMKDHLPDCNCIGCHTKKVRR